MCMPCGPINRRTYKTPSSTKKLLDLRKKESKEIQHNVPINSLRLIYDTELGLVGDRGTLFFNSSKPLIDMRVLDTNKTLKRVAEITPNVARKLLSIKLNTGEKMQLLHEMVGARYF